MAQRPNLTRERILTNAISLADKKGIKALSMRNLAGELGIQAMSLYHHFRTKDDLIAQMAERLVSEIEFEGSDPGTAGDWRTIMTRRAVSALDLFRRHPWLPSLLDSQTRSGSRQLAYLDRYVGVLRNAGLPIGMTLRVTSLIDSYIYGFCLQLTHVASDEKSPEELAGEFSLRLDASAYPYLSEATAWVMDRGYDADTDFRFGLEVILNGIARELETVMREEKDRGDDPLRA